MSQRYQVISSKKLNRILSRVDTLGLPASPRDYDDYFNICAFVKFLSQVQKLEKKESYTALNIYYLAGRAVYFLLNQDKVPSQIKIPEEFVSESYCLFGEELNLEEFVLKVRMLFLANAREFLPKELAMEVVCVFNEYRVPLELDIFGRIDVKSKSALEFPM